MTRRKLPKQAQANEAPVDALVMASFVTVAVMSRIGAGYDLSLSLMRVLGILWDRRPRMTELADHLGLEKQTMSGLIARAEARGLVARAPNTDDGRATDVFLTSEGTRLVRQLRNEGRQALAPILGRLDATEQQQLQKLLLRMLEEPGS